jgi:hypothetical protein
MHKYQPPTTTLHNQYADPESDENPREENPSLILDMEKG